MLAHNHISIEKINNIVLGDKTDLAAFSLDVYREANRPPLPEGWRLFADYGTCCPADENHYFGACYIKDVDKPNGHPQVVFAHRGVTLSSPKDLIDTLTTALGHVPAKFVNACSFVQETCIALWKKYGDRTMDNASIIQTGHSLGGAIADLMCAKFQGGGFDGAITFENPGSKPMVEILIAARKINKNSANYLKSRCHSIMADVNLINTCNEQSGSTWRLQDLPYDYHPRNAWPNLSISPSYKYNPYYFFDYTFEQHAIEKIYKFIKSGGVSQKIKQPFGFLQGYKSYLDWDSRENYWREYAHIVWLRRPDIRVIHENNYSEYLEYFKSSLRRTQQTHLRLENINHEFVFFQSQIKKESQIDFCERNDSTCDTMRRVNL